MPPSPSQIALIRHGRSGHVHTGWIDVAGFHRWREAYEAAGIGAREVAPEALRQLAATSGVIAASDARRAIESAALLAPGREIVLSPLLAELALPPPALGRARLPLFGWSLAIGLGWLARMARGLSPVTTEEEERVRAAVAWLSDLAGRHHRVVAVTHGSFRMLAAKELVRGGWKGKRAGSRHWSAWVFQRR